MALDQKLQELTESILDAQRAVEACHKTRQAVSCAQGHTSPITAAVFRAHNFTQRAIGHARNGLARARACCQSLAGYAGPVDGEHVVVLRLLCLAEDECRQCAREFRWSGRCRALEVLCGIDNAAQQVIDEPAFLPGGPREEGFYDTP